MALKIDVVTNVDDIVRHLDQGIARQLPFVTASALTRTAKEVRITLQETLGEFFVLRNAWVRGSIKSTRAEKRDLNPVAFVGSLFDGMDLQVGGGTKRSKTGKAMGVPTVGPGAPRPTLGAMTKPSKWPRQLRAKGGKKVYAEELPSGDIGLFRQKNKSSRRLLYVFQHEVEIQPRWPFREIAQATTGRVFERFFFEELHAAVPGPKAT
jgi:hypothetical protein